MAAITVLVTGCGGAKSRLAGHMNRGRDYFQAGDFTKASVEFRNAMQIDPKNPQARLMAAEAAEKLGQLPGAAGLLQSVVDDHPDNVEARTELGRLLVTAGDPHRGLEIIKPALQVRPNDASLLAIRSAAKMVLRDAAGARSDADRALAIDPKNEDAVDLRAGLYRQDGDLPAAIKLVKHAAAIQPAVPGFHQVLFSLYEGADQPALAEDQLRALVKLVPGKLSYRQQLAAFLVRSKRLDDAQKVLDDAVKTLPGNEDAKLLRVDFLVQQRSQDVGELLLRQYIADDSKNYTLRLALGALLQRQGKVDKAVVAYNDVVRDAGIEPNGLIARNRLAQIAVSEGREADARRYLAEVLRVNSHDNDALTLRSQLSLEHGDSTSAIDDLRAVLRDQPRSIAINRLLAQAMVAHGDAALAEEPLRTAMDAAPTDETSRGMLVQLLFQLNHPDKAISVIQDAIKARPNDSALREALVRAYLTTKDFAGAANAADEYRRAKPDDAAPYLVAGLVARADNRPDDAQALLEKALSVNPHAYDVLSELVQLQVQRGQEAKAVNRLQGLMAAAPKDALIPNLLGEVYLQQKEFKAAQQAFGLAIAKQPKWWMPQRNLALAKYGADDLPGAIEAYRKGLELAPTQGTMLGELGALYERAGRIDDTLKLYEFWVSREPKSQVAANNLAMLLISHHTDKASLDRAQALTAGFADTNSGDLLDTAGWVQFKRGEYGQALSVLQRAAALMPESQETHYHLGMAELRNGLTDRARADLETALTGSPQFIGTDVARAALAALRHQAS